MRNYMILLLAGAALAGCATPSAPREQEAALTAAVFTSEDPVKLTDAALMQQFATGQTKIYWYLSGR